MFWAYLVALHIVCALRLGWVVGDDLVSNLSRGFTVCLGFSLDCWVVSGLRVLVGVCCCM